MIVSRQPSRADDGIDSRANQRERTRLAVLDGARQLLLEGNVPTVADAARQARVSRATAYRYFPSQGALIKEAVSAVLIRGWEWDQRLQGARGLVARVERVASLMFGVQRDNESLLRGYLLVALQQWAQLQSGADLGEEPIQRGGRREGIDAALAPHQAEYDSTELRRLAVAMSIALGIEARIVLRDIWHMDEDEAEGVTVWMVRTLAQATVAEHRSKSRRAAPDE